MKLSDLQTGMIVETRDKTRYLVQKQYVGTSDIMIRDGGYCVLSIFKEDMTCRQNQNKDIMKVYKAWVSSEAINMLNRYSLDSCNLIWERPQEYVLTLDQIAEKFNIPVSQLKIKK